MIEYSLVNRSSAAYFAKRFSRALQELDTLDLACQVEMDECFATVELYKDATTKGKFGKAQKAALRNDRLMEIRAEIQKRRDALLKDFAKVWGIYYNDEALGTIVMEYVASKGNYAALESKYGATRAKEAVTTWKDYVNMTIGLAKTRREEQIKRQGYENRVPWWIRVY